MKALLVNPKFPQTYWVLDHALPILGARAYQPSLPLLTVAALLPTSWSLRVRDENVEVVTDGDILWADTVMLTGMIFQRDSLWRLLARCRTLGARTVVGGPYVTSTPETVPADHIVIGEGERTIPKLAKDLEEGKAEPRYVETENPSLSELPPPRYDLVDPNAYADLALQFSRGCPFLCEFCDIISLYGRVPRTKSLARITAELDSIYAIGYRGDVLFVDDNFIGNKKAVKKVLPGIAEWQLKRGVPFNFYTEASANLAEDDELIDLMVAAGFKSVFVGVETPSAASLRETRKLQNLKSDLVESIHHLYRRGLMVMGGFMLGFDSDGEDIFERMVRFVDDARIAMAMVGQLAAVPRTPLYERLQKEGRLRDFPAGDSYGPTNIVTKLPERVMARGYLHVLESLYEPRAYFDRCRKSVEVLEPRGLTRKLRFKDYLRLLRSLWIQGVKSSYRGVYWEFILWVLWHHPRKLTFAFLESIYGHHFILFTLGTVVPRLERLEEKLLQEERLASERVAASA